jgi:hypothetical protein
MKEKSVMVYEEECYQIRGALYEVYTVLGTGFSDFVIFPRRTYARM